MSDQPYPSLSDLHPLSLHEVSKEVSATAMNAFFRITDAWGLETKDQTMPYTSG
jgi:hypothetical protein